MHRRRALFLVSKQHLSGGIGTFVDGFRSFCYRNDIQLDIATDVNVNDDEYYCGKDSKGSFYANHNDFYYYEDSINFERVNDFDRVVKHLCSRFYYDLIVCNTPEAGLAVYNIGLQKVTNVVFYTHLETLISSEFPKRNKVFTKQFLSFFRNFLNVDEDQDLIIGTQSSSNVDIIHQYSKNANAKELPLLMPYTEYKFFERDMEPIEQEGVLFIGRHEDRKRPNKFIEFVQKTGMKPKVMTNYNGSKKFRQKFEEHGIHDYDIASNLSGKEKIDFVRSAKLMFYPSNSESFAYAVLDAVAFMPVIMFRNYEWTQTWEALNGHYNVFRVNEDSDFIKNAPLDVANYTSGERYNLDFIKEYQTNAVNKWLRLFENVGDFGFVSENAFTRLLRNNSDTVFALSEIFNEVHFYQNTLFQAYKAIASGEFKISQTESETLLTKDGDFDTMDKTNNGASSSSTGLDKFFGE